MQVYSADSHASFGFIGSNLPGESEVDTKRYRLYKKFMTFHFSEVHFLHWLNEQKSAYMLLSRTRLVQRPQMVEEILQVFAEHYHDLD